MPVRAAATPELNFTTLDSPSLQFLPRQQEASGWRLETDPSVVPADHLSAYLGSEAAHFSRYGVVDATVGKYAALSGDGFATAEIYRFPDFVKAFGAYSRAKDGARQYIDIANESFSAAHSIHVWRGPFYIRVIGGRTPNEAPLVALARSIADRMPAAPSKPAVFKFFPDNMRVPNSERYSAESGFHESFLGNSFQASFNVNGDMMSGLIIPAQNKPDAARLLDRYRQLYIKNGKLLDPIPNLGEDNFTAEDRYLGRAVAFRIDRFVIAFNGFKDRQGLVDLAIVTDQRILGSIRKQLVAQDDAADKAQNNDKDKNDDQPIWLQQRH
jgi:hypothetical protein